MRNCVLLFIVVLLLAGCSWVNKNFYDRLVFVEESHIGLKAKVAMDHTPGDVDFGYRRSVFALIPKANARRDGESQDCPPDSGDSNKTSPDDCKELLSVISSFNADVRWFEATTINTYFATGKAAEQTAEDTVAIKALVPPPKRRK